MERKRSGASAQASIYPAGGGPVSKLTGIRGVEHSPWFVSASSSWLVSPTSLCWLGEIAGMLGRRAGKVAGAVPHSGFCGKR